MMQPPRQIARAQIPAVFGAARSDPVEALRVRDDLRRVQRLADVLGELFYVRGLFGQRAGGEADPGLALCAGTGQRPGEECASLRCAPKRSRSGSAVVAVGVRRAMAASRAVAGRTARSRCDQQR